MKIIQRISEFFIEEWLLIFSLFGISSLTLYLHELPHYRSDQLIPIFLLWVLFVAVKGIEESGFLTAIAGHLEKGTFLARCCTHTFWHTSESLYFLFLSSRHIQLYPRHRTLFTGAFCTLSRYLFCDIDRTT